MGPGGQPLWPTHMSAAIIPSGLKPLAKNAGSMEKEVADAYLTGLRVSLIHVLAALVAKSRASGPISDYDLSDVLTDAQGGDVLGNALAAMELSRAKSLKSRAEKTDLAKCAEPKVIPAPRLAAAGFETNSNSDVNADMGGYSIGVVKVQTSGSILSDISQQTSGPTVKGIIVWGISTETRRRQPDPLLLSVGIGLPNTGTQYAVHRSDPLFKAPCLVGGATPGTQVLANTASTPPTSVPVANDQSNLPLAHAKAVVAPPTAAPVVHAQHILPVAHAVTAGYSSAPCPCPDHRRTHAWE